MVQRSHHADAGEHRRAVMLGNQQQCLYSGPPFHTIVFGFGQFGEQQAGATPDGNDPDLSKIKAPGALTR